jgi:hypothetical protein
MEAEHTALLYYCETHWLSRGAVLHRVCELNEERVLFVTDSNNNDDANVFHNGDFTKNIVYLVDIRGCIQKLPGWPPGARTANGTSLFH